jgi:hypothetical protein
LTFAYALLAGLFYYYSVVVNASDEMSELLRAYIPLYEDGISLRHSTNEEEVKERGDLDLDSAYIHLVSELTEAKSLIDKIMRRVKYGGSARDIAGQAGERKAGRCERKIGRSCAPPVPLVGAIQTSR